MIIHDTSKVHTLKFISSEHFTCAVDIYSFFFALWENEQHISTFVWNSFMIFSSSSSSFVIHNSARCVSLFPTSVDCRCYFGSMYSNLTFTSCSDFFLWMKNNTEYELVFMWKGLIHVVHVNASNEHWSSFWRVFLLTNWN